MQIRRLLLATAAAVTLTLAAAPAHWSTAAAQTAALSGQVSSAEESAMEGVVVSAKKAGSTITVSVVSDAQGNFSFPAGRLEPGSYALRIRAAGYELDGPKTVEVGPQAAPIAIKLRKAGEHRGPAHQQRMADERSRHGRAEEHARPLHQLPHARAAVQVDLRRRRADRRARAHGELLARHHAARAAPAARRAQHGCSRRPAAAARRLHRQHQSEPTGDLVLSAQDAAAAQGPLHPCDHHRI